MTPGQVCLFDVVPHPRARARDTQTALDAARSITPGRTEALIVAIYQGGGTWTDDELCEALRDHYAPTVKSARSRLSGSGVLVDSGVRRLSARGRAQIAWTKGER